MLRTSFTFIVRSFGYFDLRSLIMAAGIYGLAFCVSMITRRENGPLLATLLSFILSVFSGYGPPLATIQSWHLEWFWRACPGVCEKSAP